MRLWHVRDAEERPALLLGPLAVEAEDSAPRHRRHADARAPIARAAAQAMAPSLLVGDAAYYSRFGFSAAEDRGALSTAGTVSTGTAFWALELTPGALAGARRCLRRAAICEDVRRAAWFSRL